MQDQIYIYFKQNYIYVFKEFELLEQVKTLSLNSNHFN